jgi:hypothetical protein
MSLLFLFSFWRYSAVVQNPSWIQAPNVRERASVAGQPPHIPPRITRPQHPLLRSERCSFQNGRPARNF